MRSSTYLEMLNMEWGQTDPRDNRTVVTINTNIIMRDHVNISLIQHSL